MKTRHFPLNRKPSDRSCGSTEHTLHRRLILQGAMAAGVASTGSFSGLFSVPALADVAKKSGKKCILLCIVLTAMESIELRKKKKDKEIEGESIMN